MSTFITTSDGQVNLAHVVRVSEELGRAYFYDVNNRIVGSMPDDDWIVAQGHIVPALPGWAACSMPERDREFSLWPSPVIAWRIAGTMLFPLPIVVGGVLVDDFIIVAPNGWVTHPECGVWLSLAEAERGLLEIWRKRQDAGDLE